MATKNASNHQGQVKDPEHDGRLKGHHGGEAGQAHADGKHPDEKHAEPKKATAAKKHEEEASQEEHGRKTSAKSHKEPAHDDQKAASSKGQSGSDEDADLKSREYTDAQGNVHHHTKAYMESHKAG